MLYYVFNDEQTAINAEAYICQIGGAPVIGLNAETGLPEPDKCKTERWAVPEERLDGKWVFPYIGDDKVALYPPAIANDFDDLFPHIKEEYDET